MMAAGAATGSGLTAGRAGVRAGLVPILSSCMIVADARFAASRAFAADAGSRRIVWIDGDITDFWYGELDLLWRREKVALAGLTAYSAFFCLERLGFDRGLRVAFRQNLLPANSEEPQLPIKWILAPKPGRPVEGDIA